MSQVPLTRRQRDILEFLVRYLERHGMSPTLEEIAQEFGVNRVTIFGHVREMERKGILRRGAPGVSRSIVPADGFGGGAPGRRSLAVPLLGRVAAGAPIEAIEDPEQLDLADLVPDGKDVFALRVRGDSMIEDAIQDGDLVLVERRTQARDGETVVAVLEDGEVTLKRFYREKRGVRLQPANSAMEPILLPRVEIRGVVIGVVRQY